MNIQQKSLKYVLFSHLWEKFGNRQAILFMHPKICLLKITVQLLCTINFLFQCMFQGNMRHGVEFTGYITWSRMLRISLQIRGGTKGSADNKVHACSQGPWENVAPRTSATSGWRRWSSLTWCWVPKQLWHWRRWLSLTHLLGCLNSCGIQRPCAALQLPLHCSGCQAFLI